MPAENAHSVAQQRASAGLPLPLPEHLQGAGFASCLLVAAPQIKAARERVRRGAQALAERYPEARLDPLQAEDLLAQNLATPLFMMLAPVMVLELNVARLVIVLDAATTE